MSTRSAEQAVEFERQRATSGFQLPEGDCLGSVRDAYFGVGAHAFGGTAAGAYGVTTRRHGVYETPRFGAPCWFTGGATGAGHVGISNGGGYFWTTDFGPLGYIGDGRIRLIPITAINQHDPALKYVGWTSDIDGVEVLGMTEADWTKLRNMIVAALGASLWGLNPAGASDVLGLPDTGSWHTSVANDNIKAVLDRLANVVAGSVDLDAIAEKVADKLAARLAS